MTKNKNRIPFFTTPGSHQKTLTLQGYEIEISTAHNIDSLKKPWLELELKNATPFFLTWQWISCWIKTYHPDLISVTAKYENRIIAIGLFTLSLEKRHTFIHSYQLRLHQMGNILMDQIWMEYNDFICEESHRTKAINACLSALKHREFIWDEIILSMMSSLRALQITNSLDEAVMDNQRPAFAIELEKCGRKKKNYLDLLTANTRYQIRRSIRKYENRHGKLMLHRASNSEEALNFFREAGKFHILRWFDSGFKNRLFVEFHQNLIKESFSRNKIDLLKLTAGDETIAVMYYHIVDETVYFYLHGLKYEDDKKLKPGLVAHSLATEFYINRGMAVYDYMGGYSQYKAQLAEPSESLANVTIQRPRSRFKLERLARHIKNWIIHITS